MFNAGDITLRKLGGADIPGLARLANNKKIWANVRDIFPYPYGEKDAGNFISSIKNEDPQVTFGIEYEGALCGVSGLVLQTDVYRKTAEIGYWIGEPYWGKGIATAAVKWLVEYGFETLHLIRIQTGVFEHNIASMRVLEKNGFIKEAICRKSIYKDGKILDEHRYSITKD